MTITKANNAKIFQPLISHCCCPELRTTESHCLCLYLKKTNYYFKCPWIVWCAASGNTRMLSLFLSFFLFVSIFCIFHVSHLPLNSWFHLVKYHHCRQLPEWRQVCDISPYYDLVGMTYLLYLDMPFQPLWQSLVPLIYHAHTTRLSK